MRSSAKGTRVGTLGCISALPQRKAVLLYSRRTHARLGVGQLSLTPKSRWDARISPCLYRYAWGADGVDGGITFAI